MLLGDFFLDIVVLLSYFKEISYAILKSHVPVVMLECSLSKTEYNVALYY